MAKKEVEAIITFSDATHAFAQMRKEAEQEQGNFFKKGKVGSIFLHSLGTVLKTKLILICLQNQKIPTEQFFSRIFGLVRTEDRRINLLFGATYNYPYVLPQGTTNQLFFYATEADTSCPGIKRKQGIIRPH